MMMIIDLFAILYDNSYVEQRIQKGFTPKISGTLEHTARTKRRSMVITLLDLKILLERFTMT